MRTHCPLWKRSLRDLLQLHNEIADKAAGPKTFRRKADLIARIEALRGAQEPAPRPVPQFSVPAIRGLVGRLARRVLADPSGTPYEDVAMFVNHFVPGAKATAKSVAWYASRMRREGLDVPKRAPAGSVCVWIEDPATADRWLADCGFVKQPG